LYQESNIIPKSEIVPLVKKLTQLEGLVMTCHSFVQIYKNMVMENIKCMAMLLMSMQM
jgi:hypothetical protein